MCKIYGINPKHLAKIVKCTDKVGELSKKAADELELESRHRGIRRRR